MAIDYSSFINVLQDGNIWWRLEDAIKLGAGYQPARDEDRNLNPVLRANSNRIRVNERDLLAEFSFERYTEAHPRLLKRDDGRYVGAGEFLNWLEQYLAQNPSDIQFPCELANQVRKALAKAATERQAQAPQTFESLTLVLEGWLPPAIS